LKIAGFISYAHSDGKELTKCLADYLSNLFQDFEPVYDDDVHEGDRLEKIKEKLALCNILFVIITPGTLRSNAVEEEIEFAKKEKMKIIPCKDDYLEKNWKELPWDLDGYKGISFENTGELKRKAYAALRKILVELLNELSRSIPKKTKTEKEKITKKDEKNIGRVKGKTSWQKFSIKTKKKVHNIFATIQNGEIKNVVLDRKSLSLIFKIKTIDEGYLKSIIRRDLIDATSGKKDENFIVLVDGYEGVHDEMSRTPKQRAIQIKLPKGAREIEIIGTEREGISYVGDVKEKNQVMIAMGSSFHKNENFLIPRTIEIKVDEKVRWINNDSAAHTITSGTRTGGPDGLFDSSLFLAGATFEITLHKKGRYPYFDLVHPWINGEIIVK